jgi:hypothetical protein
MPEVAKDTQTKDPQTTGQSWYMKVLKIIGGVLLLLVGIVITIGVVIGASRSVVVDGRGIVMAVGAGLAVCVFGLGLIMS